MAQPTRQCTECGSWFFPGPSNEAGRSSAGLLTKDGPVCNDCTDNHLDTETQ